MADYNFTELSNIMQAIKAADEKLTPEERNRNDAEEGLDCIASILELIHESEEYFDILLNNPLLDKDSERIISKLWNDIGNFFTTDVHHVEHNLAHYIDDEEEDIYG